MSVDLSVVFPSRGQWKTELQLQIFCYMKRFIVYGEHRCTNVWHVVLSESAISKVQSPPTRTSRRNQSKVKSRPPEPEMDVQLLETLCNENECNVEEVWTLIFIRVYTYIYKFLPPPVCFSWPYVSSIWLFLQVKNVYQTSFAAFLESLVSRAPDFPQVNGVIVTTPPLFDFTLLTLHLLVPLAISSCLWSLLLDTWVSDSCWWLCLLLSHVWCHIHGVRKMCTQAGDPMSCVRVV